MIKNKVKKEIYEITAKDTVVDKVRVKQYGIAYRQYKGQRLETEFEIEEISEDRIFVENITEMLNQYKASPNHFQDIVEDCLIAKYTTR